MTEYLKKGALLESSVDIILVVLAACFVVYYVVQILRKRTGHQDPTDIVVSLCDVQKVYNAVKDSTHEDVFAMFLIPQHHERKGDGLPSIEFAQVNGVVGVDYVLLSKENIARQHLFVDVANALGQTVTEFTMAEIPYLRVEDGDLPLLLRTTLVDVFGIDETDRLSIILEGVDHASIA